MTLAIIVTAGAVLAVLLAVLLWPRARGRAGVNPSRPWSHEQDRMGVDDDGPMRLHDLHCDSRWDKSLPCDCGAEDRPGERA